MQIFLTGVSLPDISLSLQKWHGTSWWGNEAGVRQVEKVVNFLKPDE